MSRPAGLPKTGGRRKGVPNKKTHLLVEALRAGGVEPVSRICDLLPQLSPKEQANLLVQLLGYIYPKRKAIEFDVGDRLPLIESFTDLVKYAVDYKESISHQDGAQV
ncbi:MAG: hypothetical protein AB7F66_04670 [Bacteriovoracia bacterium]